MQQWNSIKKLKLTENLATGQDNYAYSQQAWSSENMQSIKVFLRCCNNKDVGPNLEALMKIGQFYHGQGIDILKLGFTLAKVLNKCLHTSASANFYPFPEEDKDFLGKIGEDKVDGRSIFHCFHAESCGWWNKKSINVKKLQIYRGYWYESTPCVCCESTNAHWFKHSLGIQCWFTSFQTKIQ